MYQKYTGIILKKYPLGEADELLTVFTRQDGKIRVLARSIRKLQSKLAGYLQSLNEIDFETATGSGRRQGGLPVLISVRANLISNYLREDLKKFAYALIGVETLYRMTGDNQPNGDIYESLLGFLKGLGDCHQENSFVRIFQLKLLSLSGFQFPLEDCRLEGEGLEQLESLVQGLLIDNLKPEVEREIDQFLNYVLEREIKSRKFLNSITN